MQPIAPLVKVEPQPSQERQETCHALAAQEDYGQFKERGYDGGLMEVGGNKGDADEKCMEITTEKGMRGWRALLVLWQGLWHKEQLQEGCGDTKLQDTKSGL